MSYFDQMSQSGFICSSIPIKYNSVGQTWQLPEEIGNGYMWVWNHKEQFFIKIHDFTFHEDQKLEFNWPDAICFNYYKSISAIDVSSAKPLMSGDLQMFFGEKGKKHLFHIQGNVPVRAIGFEIRPEYFRCFLNELYPGSFESLTSDLCRSLTDECIHSICSVLRQIECFRGTEPSATLFYQGKINEILSLIIGNFQQCEQIRRISLEDERHLQNAVLYIRQNYARKLSLETLANISCMGTTKLKSTFQQQYGCSITSYIQGCRMEKARKLLSDTDLSIGEIGMQVGYTNASRFSQLFHRYTGVLPKNYRKSCMCEFKEL